MENLLTYKYAFNSKLSKEKEDLALTLAKYSEVSEKNVPCFYWGHFKNSFMVSRCLLALSNVVKSSFNLSPFQLANMRDPIVTAGNETIRFEGFSHCAGVYARVDVNEGEHDGEFIQSGTTNVDFNQPMLTALGQVKKMDSMLFSVGNKDVQVITKTTKVIERKVPLPTKWIKGLATVQHYLSESDLHFTLNKLQTLQLFRTLPKGTVKTDYYLMQRGQRYSLTPMASKDAICIGGIQRLQLLTPLLPYIDSLKIYAHNNMQSVTFQLYLGKIVFCFSLSRNTWRGFSGEGALLEELIEDIPDELIKKMNNYSYANQSFNSTLLAIDTHSNFSKINNLTAKLSAMGLLGFELDSNEFFYRQLPFKTARILSLNPRLKGAEKLLTDNKVTIVSNTGNRVKAHVEGSGVTHLVILENTDKCTCTWFSQNQGERGACKHILAVKKKIKL